MKGKYMTEMPKYTVEKVDASKAVKWLALISDKQRGLRDMQVRYLCEAMKSGEWGLSNDAIMFDTNGRLINGQHRLQALIKCGMTFDMLIGRGFQPETYKIIDQQSRRTAGDALAAIGCKDEKVLAAVLNVIHGFQTHGRVSFLRGGRLQGSSPITLLETLSENPDATDAVTVGRSICKSLRVSTPTTMAFLYWRLGRIDAETRDYFFETFKTGDGQVRGAMIYRERLIKGALRKELMSRETAYALGIKAWNICRNGTEKSVLIYRPDEDMPEPK